MVEQRIVDRIAKMLRLAADEGAAEGERDNALRMAHATMAKYNLDMAQIEVSSGQKNATEERVREGRSFRGRTPWARHVAQSVAKMLFCSYFYTPNRNDRTNVTHCFVGRQSNAVTASLLAEYLVKSIMKEATKRSHFSDDRDFIKGFCLGASLQINLRVTEIIAASSAPGAAPSAPGAAPSIPGMGIALASLYKTEEQANAEYLAKEVALRAAPQRRIKWGSRESVESGRSFGNSVSLNTQLK
jgi:hypothetical protein